MIALGFAAYGSENRGFRRRGNGANQRVIRGIWVKMPFAGGSTENRVTQLPTGFFAGDLLPLRLNSRNKPAVWRCH